MLKTLIAIIVAILILAIGVFFFRRSKLLLSSYESFYEKNSIDPDINRMILYSGPVVRTPNETLSFRLYGNNAELLISADAKLNNLGLFSWNDYDFDIPKPNDEFRIVVLGGEQTASSVVDKSWPDFLEETLNSANTIKAFKGKQRLRVFNLAWPDAGPEHYIKYWKEEGQKLAPDLVIVNYVESDFYRKLQGATLKYKGNPVRTGVRIDFKVFDEACHSFVAMGVGAKEPLSLTDPNVIPSRPYGIFASRSLMDNKDCIKLLQQHIVDEMVKGAWQMVKPNALLSSKTIFGHHTVASLRNFDLPPATKVDKEKLIQFGATTFGWLQENIPNILITHNFHYGELQFIWDLTNEMTNRYGIKVEDMRKNIPKNTPDAEIRSWYMLPHMGEKWNQKGHERYAEMIAALVIQKITLQDQK